MSAGWCDVQGFSMRWAVLALVAWFLLVPAAGTPPADPVPVLVELRLPEANEEVSVALRLTRQAPLAPEGEAPEVRTLEAAAPGQVSLELPPGTVWKLQIERPGFWAGEVLLSPQLEPPRVPVTLYRTGRIEGALALPADVAPPGELSARFEAAPGGEEGAPAVAGTTLCPVIESTFSCPLPAGSMDLRLHLPGFVPVYFWAVPVSLERARSLGRITLVVGASVAGRVELATGLPAADGLVTLTREGIAASGNAEVARRLGAMSLETRSDEHGFFQLTGVAPGRYEITATRPGLAPARIAGVEVVAGLASELLDPLVLRPPARLAVLLSPPLDPIGNPWQVDLVELTRDARLRVGSWRGPASADGRWEQADLAPGPHRLRITDGEGGAWFNEEIEIRSGAEDLAVEIPVVAIVGSLFRGEEPLPGILWFGGLHGPRRIRMAVDLDGHFAGYLPSEGLWELEIVPAGEEESSLSPPPVEIERREGEPFAEVEIRIPDTRLEGEVVDEDGRRVPGAIVSAYAGSDRRRPAREEADGEGRFLFRGLPAGSYLLVAEAGRDERERGEERSSEWVPVTIGEDPPAPEIRLVLRGTRTVQGVVIAAAGPVPGARVVVLPAMGASSGGRAVQASTGPQGEFTLELPAGSGEASLLVHAPGYAARLLALPDSSAPLVLALDGEGGSLILSGLDPQTAVLSHGGTTVFLPLLRRLLGESPPSTAPGSGEWVLRGLEIGEYSLCPLRAALAARREGRSPPAAACAAGFLLPHGELRLVLPEPDGGS